MIFADHSLKQQRYNMLVKRADALFSIGWLCHILKDDSQLHSDKERLFAEAILNPAPTVMNDIRDITDFPSSGVTTFEQLDELREELIEQLVKIKTASTWHTVNEGEEQSWRMFVQRIPFGVPEREQEVRQFFATFPQICIITDILTGLGSTYGIELDETNRKEYQYQRQSRIGGIDLPDGFRKAPEFELKELRFFDMKTFGTAEKQMALSEALREVARKIDRKNGREWFGPYAAYRYAKEERGVDKGYVDFFSDIEALIPDMFQAENPDAKGDARYKNVSKALGREVPNWYVDKKHLPPINSLVFRLYHFGCNEDDFDKRKGIIQELYKWFKSIQEIGT